ncbi:unnamed protein product [Phytophthora fragariaefolia]|uniref:Unnamed protein product n=1 Tax=Phytophthora fragariaefolia TaxID=1490495 RepID=A0A9W6XWE0_9STRA|nr:unnamed protein product [Phytophthora fragariaefolia]
MNVFVSNDLSWRTCHLSPRRDAHPTCALQRIPKGILRMFGVSGLTVYLRSPAAKTGGLTVKWPGDGVPAKPKGLRQNKPGVLVRQQTNLRAPQEKRDRTGCSQQQAQRIRNNLRSLEESTHLSWWFHPDGESCALHS